MYYTSANCNSLGMHPYKKKNFRNKVGLNPRIGAVAIWSVGVLHPATIFVGMDLNSDSVGMDLISVKL